MLKKNNTHCSGVGTSTRMTLLNSYPLSSVDTQWTRTPSHIDTNARMSPKIELSSSTKQYQTSPQSFLGFVFVLLGSKSTEP
eukprot:m.58104 g.58104  ORF g.58104 m.58104 type:complete len:82 (+) comp22499_c0_seq1:1252-1497(+)